MALPWHDRTMREFTDADAVTSVLAANAPERGVYMAVSGVFASVQIDPAVPDRTQLIGSMLARQAGINLLVALVLAFLVGTAARRPVSVVALRLAALGLAAGMIVHLSQWNWFGFGPGFAVVNMIDLAIGWGIMGLVLGWLAARMLPADGATASQASARVAAMAG